LIWFIASALALEPPNLPVASEPISGQCIEAIPLSLGHSVPESLFSEGIVQCGSVAVPTSEVADLLALRVYSDEVRNLFALETTKLESEIVSMRIEIEAYSQVDFWKRPHIQRRVGIVEGALIGILIGAVGYSIYMEE
jgi:hypothetical protein